jgi:flagellar motor switch protein FliG
MSSADNLTGPQKAAILLMELGIEPTAEVTKRLQSSTIPIVTREMNALGPVTEEQRAAVKAEFLHLVASRGRQQVEGKGFAQEMQRHALEGKHAKALDFLSNIERSRLLRLLEHEHPQVGAVLLAHLPAKQASELLSSLPSKMQGDLALRLASMRPPNQTTLLLLNQLLADQLQGQEEENTGGVPHLVEMLKNATLSLERAVLETLEQHNPALAETTRRQMLRFEDLARIQGNGLQKILKMVDGRSLALALKQAPPQVLEAVMDNLSERARGVVQSDLDGFGKVRVADIEKAQQEMVDAMRDLHKRQEIEIMEANEELV